MHYDSVHDIEEIDEIVQVNVLVENVKVVNELVFDQLVANEEKVEKHEAKIKQHEV